MRERDGNEGSGAPHEVRVRGHRPPRRRQPPLPPAKPKVSPRKVALDVLDATLAKKPVPADEAMAAHPALADLSQRDRAFARLLVLTTLRRLAELDAAVRPFLRREPKSLVVRNILRLGAVQLLFLKTPAHAAVHETVKLATGDLAGTAPMLNAVLRRLAGVAGQAVEGDSFRLAAPSWLLQSWLDAYGETTARAIVDVHRAEPPLDIVARSDPERWAEELDAERLPMGVLRRPVGGLIEDLPGYAEGAWWVQDLAATLPARLLGEVRGQRVLDLCAAPGGKTMQLAAMGVNVTAVELVEKRAEIVRQNLARTGLAAEIVVADARAYEPPEPFGHVLLDAPCSATGTIRRHPDILWTKRPEDPARLAVLQGELLAAAARMLAPGGTLVYAVCSLQPEEGPAVVDAFLAQHPELTLDSVRSAELGGLPVEIDARACVRTLPCHLAEKGGMDGFFIARMKRG